MINLKKVLPVFICFLSLITIYAISLAEPLPGTTIFSTPKVVVSIFGIVIAVIIGLVVRCFRRRKIG
jgi:hypothetical protein